MHKPMMLMTTRANDRVATEPEDGGSRATAKQAGETGDDRTGEGGACDAHERHGALRMGCSWVVHRLFMGAGGNMCKCTYLQIQVPPYFSPS